MKTKYVNFYRLYEDCPFVLILFQIRNTENYVLQFIHYENAPNFICKKFSHLVSK
jgi:hypothetical protein